MLSSVLQRLKASLTEHQPQLYQVLEEGKRLLLSVGCSDLENQLTQLGEHWLSSTTKVNKELHRLDSTLKHWSRSGHNTQHSNQLCTYVLHTWMNTVKVTKLN